MLRKSPASNALKTLIFLELLKSNKIELIYRSSLPEVSLGKAFLKLCSKFTGEHPCRIVILITLLVILLKSHFGTGALL